MGVAFRSSVFTHDVVGGNGSVRRGAERWKGPSTEGDQRSTLLRVGLAISLVTSHLLRSGIQFLVRRRFSGKNNHATLREHHSFVFAVPAENNGSLRWV